VRNTCSKREMAAAYRRQKEGEDSQARIVKRHSKEGSEVNAVEEDSKQKTREEEWKCGRR